MKKSILKYTEHNDTVLIYAIASAESDLQICMKINQKLNINLTLGEDCEVLIKKESILFRRYHYESEEIIEKYQLFVNRMHGHFLFPELKKVDFLLIITTEASPASIESLLRELKERKEFTTFTKVSKDSLRSLNRIVL
jgi:hypothetical protein